MDEYFLAHAFRLARLGRFTTTPNPNVGCVIVRNGHIVGEGYHQRAGLPHAEINALHMAGKAAQGATVYITLEPCSHYGRTPPCTDALISAGIARVVAAVSDPNPQVSGRGFNYLQQAGIKVHYNLMSTEAETINLGFFKRMRTGFPWVVLKLATSLDGRIAMESGESQWITSKESRIDVQRFRAESDAILSTSATVIADNPALNVRWSMLPVDVQDIYPQDNLRQPIRVIIDTNNRITPKYRVIQEPGEVWLVQTVVDQTKWPDNVSLLILPIQNTVGQTHLIDLMLMMIQLGYRQINSVWVEAGARLAGALLNAKLVDLLIIYLAPKLLGNNAQPLCILPDLKQLAEALNFVLLDIRQIGNDVRLCLKPKFGNN